jgi:hypothetical protein
MNLSSQITILAAILSLSTEGSVRNCTLSVGTVSGAIAIFQTRPRKSTGLTDSEVLELAISSATKQVEEDLGDAEAAAALRIYSLEKLLATKTQELAELDHLTNEELERLSQEKRNQVQNLNRQIDELTQLLDEQLAEIDQRESQARQQLTLEIEQRKQEAEAELEAKRQQLEAIAQDDEAWLQQETARLTQALEADKEAFLEKHRKECDRLLDEIELLESELAAAHQLLDKYQEPEMPRGFDIEKVVAYKLQTFWRAKGIITHLISAYPDEANRRVLVRLRPKTGGQKQFKKEWLNELQIQEDLPEPPGIQTVGGAIEFEIKPRTWTAFKPWDDLPSGGGGGTVPNSPESSTMFENSSPVTQEELENFQQPIFRFDPRGAIGRLEQTWIVYLWQSGVRNQGVICSTVYRSRTGNPVSKGDGSSFINARERMYSILDLQGITYIRRGA